MKQQHQLPMCTQRHFDERQTFVTLSHRKGDDWYQAASELVREHAALHNVDASGLRDSVLEVSRKGALDLATLISTGSLLYGPRYSAQQRDHERDSCLSDVLDSVGEGARYFTNHGEAEEGDDANFLASAYHVNALAETTLDVCLIGVSHDSILILWRFEDD
ncbi:hypothetical protein ACI3K5_27620 [Streptomyces sp. MPA0124]|uniref:hypothetical protein n=1 Tax=unclassified Streptomyces TaxID=2593676 RepID=UPI0011DE56CF|nr:hypothetical protein [Streptomyces sp. CCM_MD2014]MDA4885420.1 hypothetical protein [Streptomyces sp. MS2A]